MRKLSAVPALALGLAGCGGKIATESSIIPNDSPEAQCTAHGLGLADVYITGAPSASDYSYGPSPVTCGDVSAVRLTWQKPKPNAALSIGTLEGVSSLAGHGAVITAHLRGSSVGSAVVYVNLFDASQAPVGFATTEGATTISGSFDWTTYQLRFPVPPEASTISVGVGLRDSGSLDVADVEIGPG